MTISKQIQLLDQLFHSDCWTELLLPSFTNAQNQLYFQIKQEFDPHKLTHMAGQALALDSIIGLPAAKELMEKRLTELKEEEEPAETA